MQLIVTVVCLEFKTVTNCKFGLEYSLIPDKLELNINYNMISSVSLYGNEINGLEFSFKYNIDY